MARSIPNLFGDLEQCLLGKNILPTNKGLLIHVKLFIGEAGNQEVVIRLRSVHKAEEGWKEQWLGDKRGSYANWGKREKCVALVKEEEGKETARSTDDRARCNRM